MELTLAERFNLHTRILEYIILNPGKLPDMIIPNYDRKMHFRPISAIKNTGFIVRETFNDDEQRDMFVEIDIRNASDVNIKYSIPTKKSGHIELSEIAQAKITSSSYMIEDVIMNDYRDKHFFAYGEIEKIKVQIAHVTTMLLLYAYQIRMQYGLLNIPEEIDDISIIDNFKEKPSESEENDEKELDSIKDEIEDMFHERFNKLETSNEKMSNDIESIKRDIWGFKRQMAEYTQTLFQKREVQMMDRIIEELKKPDEPDEEAVLREFANSLKELSGGVDPKLCVKVLKDRTKESNVDESVVFHCNCKDIFAKLTRISREMMAKASSTCHQGSEIAFQETINMRGDIDSDDFKKILNSTYARMCYITDYQRKCIEEGFRNSYHISCTIDSFLSGAVLYKFIVRDNLLYPKGMEVTFTFNDNHDLCVVENTLRGYDEFKNNLLTRYLMLGAKTDAWLFRELMNIGTDLRKRYEKEVERDGK